MDLPSDIFSKNNTTQIIGKNILHFPSLNSTNEFAKDIARHRISEGTVVIADRQVAGKGRLNRPWISPEGVTAYSVILYPKMSQLSHLIMIASLSVVRAIKKITGIDAQIKWPNDIQIDGKKICGILIENSLKGDEVEYAVIGIGLNTNFNPVQYPDIMETATSLSVVSGRDIPEAQLMRQLLVELDRLYISIGDGTTIFEEWRNNLVTLGQQVRATSAGNVVTEGIAETVESDGTLVIRQSEGILARVSQGDVTLRK